MPNRETKQVLKSLSNDELVEQVIASRGETEQFRNEVEELRKQIEEFKKKELEGGKEFKVEREDEHRKEEHEEPSKDKVDPVSTVQTPERKKETKKAGKFSDVNDGSDASSDANSISSAGDVLKRKKKKTDYTKDIQKPQKFNGHRSKTVVETFVYGIQKFLRLRQIPKNLEVDVFSTYLEGSAATWFRTIERDAEVSNKKLRLAKVIDALKKEFLPDDVEEISRFQLYDLSMGQMDFKKFLDSF